MNPFHPLIIFIKKLVLLRKASLIRSELKKVEDQIVNLNKYTKKIQSSVQLIPVAYLKQIRMEQKEVNDYVQSECVYSFDKTLQESVLTFPSNKKPEKLNSLEILFKELTYKYKGLLNRLEKEISGTNKKLIPYYLGRKKYWKEITQLKQQFIAHSDFNHLKEKYEFVNSFFKNIKSLDKKSDEFIKSYSVLEKSVKSWNEEYVAREILEKESFFSNIDGKELDFQQKKAVIVDEDANLVVAGAGSGKTLTISGKVKYLVEKRGIDPKEILLISYTRKAAQEMEERIKRRLKIDVEVKTFHKLGMGIISKHTKDKPDVEDNTTGIIKTYFDNEMYDDPMQLRRMIEFFGYYLNVPKDLEDFNSLGECYDHHKSIDLKTLKGKYDESTYIEHHRRELKTRKTTLQGERVKSLEEVMISNFLFLNGVEYIYENEYKYSTSNEQYRTYKPDFYLPEYDIYIEHFGITKDERTPWLSDIEEQKYVEGMYWKRELHKTNGTKLIETYSYLTKEGQLLEVLRKKLLAQRVQFKEVDFIDIFNKIYDTENSNHFNELIKFVSTFINLFKSNGYEAEKFDGFLTTINKENIFFFNRTKIFLEITKPVFEFYEKKLKELNKIDFNDMINNATSILKKGILAFNYKYIIIDEYQDISVSRYQLIEQIRELTKAKVMCVGDDWQSIYRFTGSDLTLFTEFERYFGYSELLKIEKTYRNSQQLINYAGNFVMKNPKQIKKGLISEKVNQKPTQILTYNNDSELVRGLILTIDEIIRHHGEDTEIMLLGRNNFDINFLESEEVKIDFKVIRTKEKTEVIFNKYPKLNLYFSTVHRSKGLEANNVILINAANKLTGFPNRIADDPILSLVLTDQDDFTFAEERRLFYVAITRTKNVTYILAPENEMSVFVKELIKDYELKAMAVEGDTTVSNNLKCPRCIEGHLLIRENGVNKNKFLGCSNYPLCDYRLKDIRVIENQIECPSCKGYMVVRRGPTGEFYGCSNYPHCKHTIKIQDINQKDPFSNSFR